MEFVLSADVIAALITLTFLEIVLGIDNVVFIAILAAKLPAEQQKSARMIGIAMAVATRLVLLLSIVWIMQLTEPLFSLFGMAFSGRDLILIGGGLFLLAKGTSEIHESLEGEVEKSSGARVRYGFFGVIVQIMLLDVVFSLDSVITAVGMADQVWVMATAIIIGAAFMVFASGAISRFIEEHPTVKMLALSFLLLIGLTLIADGFDFHIPKGYIYFAIGFSILVEFLNFRLRKTRGKPRPLHPYKPVD